jgi:predicted transposase/invertase (TIGR01784 family)
MFNFEKKDIMVDKNLIRFDWAMKRLLRNKASYTVLEGFLSELLKEDVEIQSILESESNRQLDNDKSNRVDLLVKNSKGELIIIEIQNQSEYDYFHRMAYGVSKVLTEYISIGESYSEIRKVYSINVVYFDLGQGIDYVYHGKTDFFGIHNADKLLLSAKQKELLGKVEPFQIFPEYYVIKVNQFDDVAKNTLDQWIYYFKNNEIREDFTAKGISQARELWRFDKLSPEEQINYNFHLKDLRNEATRLWNLKMDAELRVRTDERFNIAKGMKLKKINIKDIAELTGLSIEEIENL